MTETSLPPALVRKTIRRMAKAHYALLRGSMSLRGQTELTEGYAARAAHLDAAILSLSRGKWLYGRSTGELADFAVRTSSAEELALACKCFDDAITIADATCRKEPLAALRPSGRERLVTSRNELTWFHDTPIVPNICPIVLLAGSSFDMGRQYARQCIEVFGEFIFEAAAKRRFSSMDQDHLSVWRQHVKEHAPEMIEMADGVAEGATGHGVELSRDQALALWIGTLAPAKTPAPIGVLDADGGGVMGAYFGDQGDVDCGTTDIDEGLCSAAAAWGTATADGRLCFSASTDHDCTFQVTIIAYPDEGYPFIYTPFSVNGSVPGVGRFGLAGHPGFNTSGLAYIHHGGGGGCAEEPKDWGHGVPRGISTIHLLRYARSASEARDRELAFPTGDVGHVLGAPGGFYADDREGYVFESRDQRHPAIRKGTRDTSGALHDFLYATNNIISKDISSPAFPIGEKSSWDPIAGWVFNIDDDASLDGAGLLARRLWSVSSASRNRYLYDGLMANTGHLDLLLMISLFRRGPDAGGASWSEAERLMNDGGILFRPSAGHRLNAFVAAGMPAEREYLAAIGPITHRSVSPNRPGHGYFIYDETNSWWRATLADEAADLVAIARNEAAALAELAERALSKAVLPEDGAQRLYGFRDEVERLLNVDSPPLKSNPLSDDAVSAAAKALRGYARAQTRARQILQALAPPEEWDALDLRSN